MMGEWVFYWPVSNQILAKGYYINGDGLLISTYPKPHLESAVGLPSPTPVEFPVRPFPLGELSENEWEIWKIPHNGREGVWQIYYQNGLKKWKSTYKDGELNSRECWDKEGYEENCPEWY